MIAINEMIKIILGIAVIVAVLFGLYFFGNYFTDFFENLVPGNKILLGLI
ncbi:MAG TPA: hypothetical protein VJZ93_02820 [Candidatus Nanoarchaeia archaeon]|nr:hypothetical protein [Candidatus Nanoarchaeia archaeon]